jgi:hypothetical protein
METDAKVVREAGLRQGRTGHAGREVGRILSAMLDPAARRRGFAQASLLADWASVVGPALARRCQPLRVDYAPGRRRGGTLLVQAGGAAAIEVQHAAPQIVERVNTYFGFPAVRQLRLLQMPLHATPSPEPPPLRPLPRGAEVALAGDLQGVGDADLREALLALGCTLRRSGG